MSLNSIRLRYCWCAIVSHVKKFQNISTHDHDIQTQNVDLLDTGIWCPYCGNDGMGPELTRDQPLSIHVKNLRDLLHKLADKDFIAHLYGLINS